MTKGEFEEAIGLKLARKLWTRPRVKGDAVRPSLVILSGMPLSGKSTLARAILRHAREPTVLIENDDVRLRITRDFGGEGPKFTQKEHRMTYNVSWELIRLALESGCHAIFDATNRTERGREGAYNAAVECGASSFVVFVGADDSILNERYRRATSDKKRAFDKQSTKRYSSTGCSSPSTRVKTSVDPETLVAELPSEIFPIPLR